MYFRDVATNTFSQGTIIANMDQEHQTLALNTATDTYFWLKEPPPPK